LVGLTGLRDTSRTPLRVLIVEDSKNDALPILRELKRGGYEPVYEQVETPETMKKALAGSEWDVIISDYRLPRFGAPEALAIFQESGLEAPFIVVSGKVGEDAAVAMMRAGVHDFLTKDNLTRLSTTVERGLEEAEERRRAERELRRRDAILEAVRFAAERFLSEAANWEESIEDVLKRLGKATGVSRVYIFENYTGEDGELWATYRYEWVEPGVSAQTDNPLMVALPFRAAGYGRWAELWSRGEPVCGHTREFPEIEQTELRAQDILSIVVVPIFVEGEWWGQIGFDECFAEREWSAAEMEALKAAASTLGAALQRRRIEEELQGSEERYRAVMEQATDGICLLDADTRRILETNPSFQKMLGYPADELRGMEVYGFVAHPREDVDSRIRLALEQKRRLVAERKYRRKDRSLLDVEVGVSVIFYGDKQVICTIVRDITERKRAEEELARSRHLFERIAETSPEILYVFDLLEGRNVYANHRGEQILGYAPEQIAEIGDRFAEVLLHPDDKARVLNDLARVGDLCEGEVLEHDYRMLHADGSYRWLRARNVVFSRTDDGRAWQMLGLAQDITERKRAEAELTREREFLTAMLDSLKEGIVACNADGNLTLFNRATREFHGIPEEEIGPEEWAERYDLYRADGRTPMRKEEIPLFRAYSGESVHDVEMVIAPKDGPARTLLANGQAFYDDEGNKLGAVVAMHDITERKRAEEALRQSEQLYRTVIEQAAENIFLVDVETRRIVGSNPAFQAALGYTEEELRGMTLYDIVAHERDSIDSNVRRVLEQKRYFIGERKYRRKDGSLADVEVSVSMILYDGRETLCVVAHDVTERARVQGLLEERVATLSRIAANPTLDLPMEDTLDVLAEGVVKASTAIGCAVVLIEEGTDTLRLVGAHGLPEGYATALRAVYRAGAPSPTVEAFRTRQPVLVRDVRRFTLANALYAPIHRFVRQGSWDAVYIVPLVSRGRALGAINFYYPHEREPSEDEKVFLGAVADQTAIAIENARLFAEARDKAALEERQRLARELHDSVSQALYGIALGAKSARDDLVEGDPRQALDPLDYVLSLAEAGLAEMRALIFELRPESLETEGLVAALEKQTAALRARHEVRVEAVLCEEPEASAEAKEAVYRIAQEALHNTIKHAQANNVAIKMEYEPRWINLEVSDDGVGFEVNSDFPGHLGLRSMRERASRLGGKLEVETAPERGTRIRARIPV
jgi:PAS domain S-box-containing protein